MDDAVPPLPVSMHTQAPPMHHIPLHISPPPPVPSPLAWQETADRVKEPARSELGSRVRYYLFAALAFVLAAEVGLDLQSGAPSAPQDVLYTVLALLLGWTALNERRATL